MQLEVQEIQALEPVKFNYEDIKNWLITKTKEYKDVVYTPETITLARQDRATLNKVSSAINDEKKRIKNELLKPYVDFENKCKELMSIVDDASGTIDKQIKEFELKEQEEKKEQIKIIFNSCIGDLKEIVSLETIFNPRWLNKTYSNKKIQEDINHIVVKTHDDLKIIDSQILDEGINKAVKSYYLRNITNPSVLSLAIQEGMKIDENNKKMEELKKQKAEQEKEVQNYIMEQAKESDKFEEKNLLIIDFRVTATKEQFMAIREFFEKNNINYGRI